MSGSEHVVSLLRKEHFLDNRPVESRQLIVEFPSFSRSFPFSHEYSPNTPIKDLQNLLLLLQSIKLVHTFFLPRLASPPLPPPSVELLKFDKSLVWSGLRATPSIHNNLSQ